jgi:hypothetical protein
MDVLAMKRAGMTFTEIGAQTGYHPATISKWCREGGPPAARTIDDEDRVVDPLWADRLTALLVGNSSLLATSLFEIIRAEGFDGSYPRWRGGCASSAAHGSGGRMRRRCRSRPRRARKPSSTSRTARRGRNGRARAGVVVLRDDLVLVALAAVVVHHVGRPGAHVRRDRPVLRRRRRGPAAVSHGPDGGARSVAGRRFKLHPPTLEFARHHGTEIKACQAGDAKRKGKIERPFRDLSESFLEELVVTGVPDDDRRVERIGHEVWVDARVHDRRHRTTGVRAGGPVRVEHGFLKALPACGSTPTTSRPAGCIGRCRSSSVDGVRYSVPPTASVSSSRSANPLTATTSASDGPAGS